MAKQNSEDGADPGKASSLAQKQRTLGEQRQELTRFTRNRAKGSPWFLKLGESAIHSEDNTAQ